MANLVANKYYDYADLGISTVRIPKSINVEMKDANGKPIVGANGVVKTVNYSPSKTSIVNAARDIRTAVSQGQFDVLVPPSFYRGVKDEDRKKMYQSRIWANGTLANDGDEGVRLIDGEGNQVWQISHVDGKQEVKPLKWKWQEAESLNRGSLNSFRRRDEVLPGKN